MSFSSHAGAFIWEAKWAVRRFVPSGASLKQLGLKGLQLALGSLLYSLWKAASIAGVPATMW